MALLAFEQSTFISFPQWFEEGPWFCGQRAIFAVEFSISGTDKANHSGLGIIIALDCVTQPLLFVSTENISTDPNDWLQVLNSIWSHHIATFFAIFTAFGSGVREMGALSYRLPSSTNIELIWLQCHFTQLKPISINWLPNIAWALLKSRGPNLALG